MAALRFSVLGLLVLWGLAVAAAGEPPIVLEAGTYPGHDAARKAWKPVEDSPPVEAVPKGGIRLFGNFKTNKNWRVAWDQSGRWDLSSCRALELDVESDAKHLLRAMVYLQSGVGWYKVRFEILPGRHTAVLARRSFSLEGQPSGWKQIVTVRFAIMHGNAEDISLVLKGLRARVAHARVAIYQNTAGIKHEGGIPRFVREMAERLDRLGVVSDIVEDRTVEAGKLAGKRLLLLPLNPVLSPRAGEALRKFSAAGGKLIACYALPDPLGELLGIRSSGSLQSGGLGALAAFALKPGADGKRVLIKQESWLARKVAPKEGTEVLAHWADRSGKVSGDAAITQNKNGIFIGHVLTPLDSAAKDRFLLESLERLAPGLAKEAYAKAKARLGRLAGFKNLKALRAAIAANAAAAKNEKSVREFLDEAKRRSTRAEQSARSGDFLDAHRRAAAAHSAYRRAYAASLPPRPNEFRALWAHSPLGIKGWSWERTMKALAENGFNNLIVNMLWGTSAAYESKVLLVSPTAKEHGDQLRACLAAAKKHGIKVHAWMVCWRVGRNTPKAFREALRKAGRLQADPNGQTLDWLSPAHPANQKLEREALLEIVRRYAVDGIHFDYIRYPGPQGGYSVTSRKAFEKQYGLQVKDWPRDVMKGTLRKKFLQFRRENITRLVKAVSEEARKIRPKIKISAAVFWNWPSDRNGVGQDWPLWIEKGYLDFVCPMTYTPRAGTFAEQVRLTQKWAGGRIPLYPGIGMTLGQAPGGTLQQVLITRKQNTGGYVLFDLNENVVNEYLPLFHLGLNRK